MSTHPSDGWYEGLAICIAISVVIFTQATQNWHKQKQFAKLNAKILEKTMLVTRNGHDYEVLIQDLLVGDIVHINCGDAIPADGVLVQGFSIEVDQSNISGESKLVSKHVMVDGVDDPTDMFLISGTKVDGGSGKFVVLAVGRYSFSGMQRQLI
jgi:Ca2+-transporting ATPase